MTNDVEQRLEAVESRVNSLSETVERLEAHLFAPSLFPPRMRTPAEPTPVPVALPRPRTETPQQPPKPQKPWTDQLEELLGGRLLAWAGGIAVVLGAAFFVAMAMKRGWIDEQTRIILSFVGAFALGCTGVWLHERKGRTQASMAMVGTSIGALYLTLTAATQLYDLIAAGPALASAFAIGTAATAVAVRWDSPVIAGLGIVGALPSPVLVGADMTSTSLAFVLIALASAVGVVLWRRWDWLAVIAFLVSAPQLLLWAFDSPALAGVLVALTLFWVLNVVAGLGYELRVKAGGLRPSSALLLTANAGMAALGYAAIEEIDHGTAADIWISMFAAAHLGLGLVAMASRRVAREIGVLAVALGVLLADLALGLIVSGPALAAAWAAGALVFVLIGREEVGGIDLRRVALVWQLALASIHVFVYDASPETLVESTGPVLGGILALVGVAVAYIVSARCVPDSEHQLRTGLDAAGLAILAYLAAYSLDGVVLTATWSGAAVLLVFAGSRINRYTPYGVAALIGLALGHVLAFEAEPESLAYGVADTAEAILAIGAVAAAALAAARLSAADDSHWRLAFEVVGGSLLVYLGSVTIIDAFQPDTVFDTGLDVEVRQRGQAIMSAFWSLAGVSALVTGLVKNSRPLRLAGFTLLALAAGKVFMYDLATLEAIWRVLSFVALGLLLLVGALAYQRMQPGERSDLSENGANAR